MSIPVQDIINTLRRDNLLQEVVGFLPDDGTIREFQVKSSDVQSGDVFICIRGFASDGHTYAGDAINRGAVAIVTEYFLDLPVPQFRVEDTRRAAALLARRQYNDPTAAMAVIGVTGTNGKTTFAHLVDSVLRGCGYHTGMIGTLGHSIDGMFFPSERTTPDIFDLNEIFARMRDAGVTHVVMEVSSHSIALHRIYGVHFKAVAFTNLTRDHLDFHGTMEAYSAAKYTVFEYLADEDGIGVFNLDDATGKKFYTAYPCRKVGVSFQDGDYPVTNLQLEQTRSRFDIAGHTYVTQFIGRHNVANAALAIATVREAVGLTPEQIAASLETICRVPGRLEAVPNELGIGIFVDYGHTDDALLHVLSSLLELPHHRLLCLFGAGGDRDHGKRPMMARVALKLSDLAYVTSDNPRTEDPAQIIRDVLSETSWEEPYWIISDRRQAIRTAIMNAQPGDIVLLAGKGHETYQEIGKTRVHFDDREEALFAVNQPRVCIPGTPGSATIPLSYPIDPLMLEQIFGQPAPDLKDVFRYVSTDTRTLSPYSLYFALAGDNHDGHHYLDRALYYETVCAVVHKPSDNSRTILVDDTTQAYLKLARKYLSLFAIRRIAITGSVGKTSTKEMLFNVLSEAGCAMKSHANENNRLGLAKTIFRLDPQQNWGIFELGTNHPGEIEEMADILSPEASLITSVGSSHLEFFGSEQGVFDEKTSLFRHTSGPKVYPGDNPLFRDDSITGGISYGLADTNDYYPENVRVDGGQTTFVVRGQEYLLPTDVPHQLSNALGVIAICVSLGVEPAAIRRGLAQAAVTSMRMEVREIAGRTVIVDCYNANPDSMRSAISYWAGLYPKRPHAAILGDMLELGPTAPSLHREIGQHLRAVSPKISSLRLAGVGMLSAFFAPDVRFETVEALLDTDWIATLPPNAVVLLKGSHGIHLERTIAAFADQERE
jgi:murE/murF fusion protein